MFKSAAKSHIGHVRSCNEDSFIENTELGLWLVADGVGGNAHGDFASQVVAQTVERRVRMGRPLKEAIEDSHRTIIKLGQDNSDICGMASTVVAVHFNGQHYQICWVGDSRAYLISQLKIRQLTTDHNQAQHLVETGDITIEEARTHPSQRVLMHAVGIHDEGWKVDQLEGDLEVGDKILLCSDGLSGELKDDEIFASTKKENPLTTVVGELIDKALTAGGSDNITVALVSLDLHGIKPAAEGGRLYHSGVSGGTPLTSSDISSISSISNRPKVALKYLALGGVTALVVMAAVLWLV